MEEKEKMCGEQQTYTEWRRSGRRGSGLILHAGTPSLRLVAAGLFETIIKLHGS